MTPLNTIIEEEAERISVNLDGRTVTSHAHYREMVKKEVTPAMQRAFEAGEKKGREEEKKRIGELLERGGFRVKTLLR